MEQQRARSGLFFAWDPPAREDSDPQQQPQQPGEEEWALGGGREAAAR